LKNVILRNYTFFQKKKKKLKNTAKNNRKPVKLYPKPGEKLKKRSKMPQNPLSGDFFAIFAAIFRSGSRETDVMAV
jgi:ribosomal protein L13E